MKELEAQLLQAEIKAEFYDEMINVAEAKFRIPIRKKSWRQTVDNLHATDSGRYHIQSLCGLVGVSKQAYYQYDEDASLAKAASKEFALQYAKDVRKEDPGIGGWKIWDMYRKEFRFDNPIGRDRFCRIIDENRLKVRQRVRKPRTTDNGSEFVKHSRISKDLRTTVYFADSYASWQKGAIENMNKLVRQYLPKGTDFRDVTDEYVKNVQYKLNRRPREKLNFSTRKMSFSTNCCNVALAS